MSLVLESRNRNSKLISMRAKVIIPAIILLLASVFIGNWVYGKMSAKKLDAYLKQFPETSQIDYSDVKVNPLWSKITIEDFSYTDKKTKLTVKSEVLYVDMKHREALEISKTRRIDELTKLGLDFRKLEILEGNKVLFVSDNTQFYFEGNMNKEKLDNLDQQFPDEKQELTLKIKDGEWLDLDAGNGAYEHLLTGTNKIETAELKMVFDPSDKRMEIEKFKIKAEELYVLAEAKVNYKGRGMDDFSASKIDMDYDCELLNKMSWGDSHTTGRYTLESFNSVFDGVLEFDEEGEVRTTPAEANFAINLEGLTVQYEGSVKSNIDASLSMLGLTSDDLSIDELSFYTKIDADKWVVEKTRIVFPVFEASIDANLNVNDDKLENPDIEELQMRITNIRPKLNESLNSLAGTFGFKIPRDGDDILFEVKGTLEKPQVKGIHY